MSLSVALLVLFSAVLHASWNAIVRIKGDRLAVVTLLATFGALIALPGVVLLPFPPADAWPWLIASMLLHIGYNVFLANAYQHGELGKVYPLARGTAPLITLVASLFIVGEALGPLKVLGVVVLGLGIIALTFDRGIRVLMEAPKGAVYALTTSLFIGGYTISDGLGARTAGDALAYTAWLFVLDGFPLLFYAMLARGRGVGAMFAENWKAGLLAGALSIVAYAIVIWAMTVAPIALVAALRETSVVMAVVIGVVFLGEKLTTARMLSVAVVLSGLVLLRL
ncbi:EamA family transporter [Microbaculum sp. FT89]|uniref:EamA family transporter n=1 Tax=Microbaculum sp. FT89 TaxID=3447298 RepID=UPI003F53C53B